MEVKWESQEVTVEIQNKLGLHARSAALFVQLASKFRSDIYVEKDGLRVNGKSIMGLMMLAANEGSRLRIIAAGIDALEATRQLKSLIVNKFGEE